MARPLFYAGTIAMATRDELLAEVVAWEGESDRIAAAEAEHQRQAAAVIAAREALQAAEYQESVARRSLELLREGELLARVRAAIPDLKAELQREPVRRP